MAAKSALEWIGMFESPAEISELFARECTTPPCSGYGIAHVHRVKQKRLESLHELPTLSHMEK